MEALLLKRMEQLESSVTNLAAAVGAAASEVVGGTAAPEGTIVGTAVGQVYTQFTTTGDGSALLRTWVFNGVPGTATGWA